MKEIDIIKSSKIAIEKTDYNIYTFIINSSFSTPSPPILLHPTHSHNLNHFSLCTVNQIRLNLSKN